MRTHADESAMNLEEVCLFSGIFFEKSEKNYWCELSQYSPLPTLGEQRKCRRLRPGDSTTSETSSESAVQSAPYLGHHPAHYETVAQVVLYFVTCTMVPEGAKHLQTSTNLPPGPQCYVQPYAPGDIRVASQGYR